jgi:hypothetical protein
VLRDCDKRFAFGVEQRFKTATKPLLWVAQRFSAAIEPEKKTGL